MKTIATMVTLLLISVLAGCNADIASPFDKPDETTQPVTCQAEGCAK